MQPGDATPDCSFTIEQPRSKLFVVRPMKRVLLLAVVVSLSLFSVAADEPNESKAVDRVQAAAEVLNEIQTAPDSGVPQEILSRAECVAVVPSMLKGGFIVGAKYGR